MPAPRPSQTGSRPWCPAGSALAFATGKKLLCVLFKRRVGFDTRSQGPGIFWGSFTLYSGGMLGANCLLDRNAKTDPRNKSASFVCLYTAPPGQGNFNSDNCIWDCHAPTQAC